MYKRIRQIQHAKQHLDNIQYNIHNIENYSMTNHELLDIIEEIKESERTDLKGIAKKCGVDRSYLSTLVNLEEVKGLRPALLRKFGKAYPSFFGITKKPNRPNTVRRGDSAEVVDILREDRLLFADIIKINLTAVLETLRTVGVRQEADEEVILRSLARLEGKPENELFEDAGRRKSQIEKDADKFGRSAG